jgi:amidase
MSVKSSTVKRISRDSKTYSFSPFHSPIVTIDPGEILVVETHDARSGTVTKETDLLDKPHPDGLNPVSGPIYVNGAVAGDLLRIEILSIDLERSGFTAVKAGVGLLAARAHTFVTRIIRIDRGTVFFNEAIFFPARPMIGTIGVAPQAGEIPSLYPGPHGGNMDNNYASCGSKVHLPVFVPGALLSLGDVHACMGDGEVSMIGLDIAGEVTLRVDLIKNDPALRPWIETADGDWVTTGDGVDIGMALRTACDEMVSLLMRRLQLSFEEAYMLASIRADLGICQACDPGNFPATVRMCYRRAS